MCSSMIVFCPNSQTARESVERRVKNRQNTDLKLKASGSRSEGTETPSTQSDRVPSSEGCGMDKGSNEDQSKDSNGRAKVAQDRLKDSERRIATRLAIVTGAFILCWGPFFFFLNFLVAKCFCCSIDWRFHAFAILNWIGLCNSGLNPIIYTLFRTDLRDSLFRQSKRIKTRLTRRHFFQPTDASQS